MTGLGGGETVVRDDVRLSEKWWEKEGEKEGRSRRSGKTMNTQGVVEIAKYVWWVLQMCCLLWCYVLLFFCVFGCVFCLLLVRRCFENERSKLSIAMSIKKTTFVLASHVSSKRARMVIGNTGRMCTVWCVGLSVSNLSPQVRSLGSEHSLKAPPTSRRVSLLIPSVLAALERERGLNRAVLSPPCRIRLTQCCSRGVPWLKRESKRASFISLF